MLFRVSGRGRPSAPAGRRRKRRMAVARLGGDAGPDAPRRGGGRLLGLGRFVLQRLLLRALLLRSRRALARLRDCYAEMMRGLVADAAAAEPVKAGKVDGSGSGGTVAAAAGKPMVVPAVVAGAVLRCNSHYYIR
ncbi:unnamed protein product [Urochloa decumbens]|uniref:Uncharacterized protein n=1 Tax=Urochloa decumbens TaxID=240449 RepID=A0ABC9G6N2_9POAL